MGSAQVLARMPGQLTLLPSVSEPNFYFFLRKDNFFSFPPQFPVAQGSTGSESFTQSSQCHDIKTYPFLRHHRARQDPNCPFSWG